MWSTLGLIDKLVPVQVFSLSGEKMCLGNLLNVFGKIHSHMARYEVRLSISGSRLWKDPSLFKLTKCDYTELAKETRKRYNWFRFILFTSGYK